MRPRSLRLLDAGRAPAAWLFGTERHGARLRALDRACAWAPALAAVHPVLRRGALFGDALGPLASAAPPSPSPSSQEAALPAPVPRRVDSAASTRSPRRAAASTSSGAEEVAVHPRPPRERRAADPGAADRRRARAAALPRRAEGAVLRRASGPGWTPPPVRRAVDLSEWDAFVRRPSLASRTPSPHTLPHVTSGAWERPLAIRPSSALLPVARVRQAASAAPGVASQSSLAPWVGAVARRAAARFLRDVASDAAVRTRADGDRGTVGPRRADPSASRDSGPTTDGGPLAMEWDAPLDGPAAPADVLARLASRMRTAANRGASAADRPRSPSSSSKVESNRPPARPAQEATDGGRRASTASTRSDRPDRHRLLGLPPVDPRRAGGRAPDSHEIEARELALRTPAGVLRARLRPLLRSGSSTGAAGSTSIDPGPAAQRDRWTGWPIVLPWPRREAGVDPGGPAPSRRPTPAAGPRADASAGAEPTRQDDAREPAPRTPAAPNDAAGSAAAAGMPRAGEPLRHAPLPAPMTPGPFPPRAVAVAGNGAEGAAKRPPAPLATGEDAAAWTPGRGAPAAEALPAHPFAAEMEPAEDDDTLARRIARILDGEARRHGIPV